MPPTPLEGNTVNYLQAILLGVYLGFAMMAGAFLGALLYDAYKQYAANAKAAREDLSR